jgi:hypothetical protein
VGQGGKWPRVGGADNMGPMAGVRVRDESEQSDPERTVRIRFDLFESGPSDLR